MKVLKIMIASASALLLTMCTQQPGDRAVDQSSTVLDKDRTFGVDVTVNLPEPQGLNLYDFNEGATDGDCYTYSIRCSYLDHLSDGDYASATALDRDCSDRITNGLIAAGECAVMLTSVTLDDASDKFVCDTTSYPQDNEGERVSYADWVTGILFNADGTEASCYLDGDGQYSSVDDEINVTQAGASVSSSPISENISVAYTVERAQTTDAASITNTALVINTATVEVTGLPAPTFTADASVDYDTDNEAQHAVTVILYVSTPDGASPIPSQYAGDDMDYLWFTDWSNSANPAEFHNYDDTNGTTGDRAETHNTSLKTYDEIIDRQILGSTALVGLGASRNAYECAWNGDDNGGLATDDEDGTVTVTLLIEDHDNPAITSETEVLQDAITKESHACGLDLHATADVGDSGEAKSRVIEDSHLLVCYSPAAGTLKSCTIMFIKGCNDNNETGRCENDGAE